MKYLSLIKIILLLLIKSLLSTPVTGGCSFDNKIRPNIIAIGRLAFGRPASIKVTWPSVNSSKQPVLYQVRYNKTSMMNHCVNPTTDALYTAKHCDQNSTAEGIIHECDLTEDYKMLKMNNILDNLCVVISISSPSSNETCYSWFQEFNSYNNEVICPAPEDLQVHSFEAGKIAVNWNVSRKFVGDTALKEMSFTIQYKPVEKSNICTVEESKTLSTYEFLRQNNTYVIYGLGPCCPYIVTICCAFTPSYQCHPGHVSRPLYVTVAEQEPTSAPQVVMYDIRHQNLLVKWKIPPNYMCIDKIKEYEIRYWEKQDKNCSRINSGSPIKRYITNRSSDREANITVVLSSASHCFRIRMCNHPGCGPWSTVYSVEDYTLISAKKSTSSPGLKNTTVLLIAAGLSVVVLIMVVSFCFIIKGRNRQGRPRRLEDTVPDPKPATELIDTSQSTTETDDDYATA